MDSYFATRRRLKLGLVIAGAVGGAIIGAALTVLGKIVGGAPPATLANYEWNMATFGVIGAVVSPVVTWSALRRVPLWRAVTEPLVAGVAGAVVGVLVGSGPAFLILTPVGIGAAVLRLNYVHRDKQLPRRAPKRTDSGAEG